jgi:hypothetical protein
MCVVVERGVVFGGQGPLAPLGAMVMPVAFSIALTAVRRSLG